MSGETEQHPSGWTIDSLHSHLLQLFTRELARVDQAVELERARLEERWMTQTRATEAAFAAQQAAMFTAFTAADKAVTAAMAASEKAVDKAERASEQRFANVNEFRQTLADQATQFISRAEAEARILALDAKMVAAVESSNQQRGLITTRISEMQSRLDTTQGSTQGANEAGVLRQRAIAQMIAVAGVVFGFIGTALAILIATGR